MSVTIKRPEELELMREAGKILAKVHEQLGNELRPGMSTYEIDRIGEERSEALAVNHLLKIIVGIRLLCVCQSMRKSCTEYHPKKNLSRKATL